MPRKEFQAFTRLDASDVNDFLMDQTIMVFGGTAARGSAIATPTDGMYTHLTDTDSLEYWNGSAWVETDSGGKVVQVVNFQTGDVATGSTTIPWDNTIPQNTEGTQFMELSITPTNASNILIIEVLGFFGCGNTVNVTGALFQDSNANAIAASGVSGVSGNNVIDNLRHYMVAGTTSATTFKYRVGPGAGATMTFNGTGGSRRLGGVLASGITITELKP